MINDQLERSLPISARQHLIFCEPQCALIHNEQQWAENRFTAEGNIISFFSFQRFTLPLASRQGGGALTAGCLSNKY